MTAEQQRPLRRGAWLEIDLAALRHNVAVLRSIIGPAGLAPVIKAEAYGHGLLAVGRALADVVDAFCVATLDEAMALRRETAARTLLLYPVPPEAAADAIASGAELTVMSGADLRALLAALPVAPDGARPPVPIQLALETGLNRGGLLAGDALDLAAIIAAEPRLRLAGAWSHLARSDDPETAGRQVARFEATLAQLAGAGTPVPERHLAATGAVLAATSPLYDLVRPGLALYGVGDPDLPIAPALADAAAALRTAMALKARAAAYCEVPTGDGVGYGGRWRAERPSRIAILPVGYADGYLRGAQPGAVALVRGTRVPLVGVISMDALAVDVTDLPGLDERDEFVLMGSQGHERITAGELARARNTIPWEVLSSMAARLDRVYHAQAGGADGLPAAGAVPHVLPHIARPGDRGPGRAG